MKELHLKNLFTAAALVFFSISSVGFSVHADDAVEVLTARPESSRPPKVNPEFRFEQSMGTGFSSDRGFMALYRIDAQGSFWSLNNDFAVILDRLSFTLQQRFEVNDLFSFGAEAPLTLDWQGSSKLLFQYAGRGKINLHNRRDPRDERPGWNLWAEAILQANGKDGASEQITSFASDPLSASPSSRSRTGLITEATFYNDFLTPSFGVSSYYDMGSTKPTEVMVSGSLMYKWGSREQKTKLSFSTPVVSTSAGPRPHEINQELNPPTASTRVTIEQGWGSWMGKFEYSSVGSLGLIGYRF